MGVYEAAVRGEIKRTLAGEFELADDSGQDRITLEFDKERFNDIMAHVTEHNHTEPFVCTITVRCSGSSETEVCLLSNIVGFYAVARLWVRHRLPSYLSRLMRWLYKQSIKCGQVAAQG